MTKQLVANDAWVMGQLAGIRTMERELNDAFKARKARTGADLSRRVAQLNAWVSLVDDALSARASVARRA
jgi:hypothetical protein